MKELESRSTIDEESEQRGAGMYELLEEIGSGGMSHVRRARHLATGSIYAVKVLQCDQVDPAFERRLRREPEIQHGVGHQNIVQLHDWFRVGDQFYLVMEYVDGETLSELLHRSGPLSFERARRLFEPLLNAVGHLHTLGVIHRDIKPGNILLDKEGGVKLSDFGIAKYAWQEARTETQLGIGTPEYMSPEQVRGGSVDHRTDIYSLSITLFEMLTARRPFARTDPSPVAYADVIQEVLNGPLPDIRSLRPELPSGIVAVLTRATAKDPNDRYADCEEFLTALNAIGIADDSPETFVARPGNSGVRSGLTEQQKVRSRQRTALWTALVAMLITIGGIIYGNTGDSVSTPSFVPLHSDDARRISSWFAASYSEASRERNAKGVAALFAARGVDYQLLPQATRQEIEVERSAYFANATRKSVVAVEVDHAAAVGDSVIQSIWRSTYQPGQSSGDTVPRIDSTLVIIGREGDHFAIVSFLRIQPSEGMEAQQAKAAAPVRTGSASRTRVSKRSGNDGSVLGWLKNAVRLNSNDGPGKKKGKKKHGK